MILKKIPLTPSSNQIYANNYNRGKGRYLTRIAEDWKKNFSNWCLTHASALNEARRIVNQRGDRFLELHIHFYFLEKSLFFKKGTLIKNDTENRLKLLTDSLANVLYCDDSLFKNFTIKTFLTNGEEHLNIDIQANVNLRDSPCLSDQAPS